MKLNMQNIIKWKGTGYLLAVAILSGLLFFSCDDNDKNYTGGSNVVFGLTNRDASGIDFDEPMPEGYICYFPQKGGRQDFFVNTDVGAWTLTAGEGKEDWVEVWPNEGKGDGRFKLRGLANLSAYTKDFTLNLVDSKGNVVGSIPILQDPAPAYIKINYSASPKYVSSKGDDFLVKVDCNAAWMASTEESWIIIGEPTENTQQIILEPNTGVQREGTVTFSLIGFDGSVTMTIKQLDSASDLEQATKVSIADLFSRLNANGVGTINENLYIEGTIISDPSKVALAKSQMVVQDDNHKGIWIEFSNDDDNTFNLNDKVKLHMYGASFVQDEITKASKVESFSPSFVHDVTPTAGIAPVELDEIDDLSQYENVLVTFKEVEFPLPFGTYVNIVETWYNKKPDNWTATAEPFADDTYNYGHLVRDKKGNLAKMYTSPSFLDRFKIVMPFGSGSLTGIIMKRIKNNKTDFFIRIRNNEDNKVSADKATALSKDIMQLGPWDKSVALAGIYAQIGTGTLEYSGRPNQNASASSTPDAFYYASSQMRMQPYEVKPDGTPVVPYTNSLSFWGINTQYWWGNPASSISSGSSGEAWIITTSTLSAVGGGDLYLQIASSSSTSGPAHFTVEWAEDAATPFNQWNKVADYTVCDINNSQHLMQYAFKLPAETKGKGNLVIRLRVNSRQRATLTSSNIANGGTNRLGVIRLTQLKN